MSSDVPLRAVSAAAEILSSGVMLPCCQQTPSDKSSGSGVRSIYFDIHRSYHVGGKVGCM